METIINKKYFFTYSGTTLRKGLTIAPVAGCTAQTSNTVYQADTLEEIQNQAVSLGFDFSNEIQEIEEKWSKIIEKRSEMFPQTDIAIGTPDFANPILLTQAEKDIITQKRMDFREIKTTYNDPGDPDLRELLDYNTWGLRPEIVDIIKNVLK